MSKIRVLSDHLVNQIAAGEVVERPASVAKELVENAIDAGARRVEVDVEAGGRRLLRVADDGEGMTRDDAVLAFERHATSKIASAEDLERIGTLGFRGEALASIASVARVELITQREAETEGTRVIIEGGRMRDVAPAARPRGTTITVRDLFFNVPARRKFLRSEATETYHLTNLVTHYALAHPEIAFTLTNNGREMLRAATAATLRERAYQLFGAEFIESLLEVGGSQPRVARVGGYVSAPRERRTTRDAQYLFVNGRYVRDKVITRALSEGFRTVLPQGVYPAALLFLDVPLEEVDVNVHPAKTEVRFRRHTAVADTVRDAVRATLAAAGHLRTTEEPHTTEAAREEVATPTPTHNELPPTRPTPRHEEARQESIEFAWTQTAPEDFSFGRDDETTGEIAPTTSALDAVARSAGRAATQDLTPPNVDEGNAPSNELPSNDFTPAVASSSTGRTPSAAPPSGLPPSDLSATPLSSTAPSSTLPPLGSAAGFVREVAAESLSPLIRPLGQLDDSFIVATDAEGLLLIDQHAAHERILFDKYRRSEAGRAPESQHLLVPETFDLTPAQAAAFDAVAEELEHYGFSLTRLSGRTVAVRAVPADLGAGDARNLLAEMLDTAEAERRGGTRETLRDRLAATLARRAAVKPGTPLAADKMRWLITRLLQTSSPTTSPRGRPVILRLGKRDIERGFHRT